MRIVVLGSFVQACCWQVPRLPQAGETLMATDLWIEAGGKGLNVAIGTRRLGAEVAIILGIGQDSAGNDLLQLLQQEGIDARYVWRLSPQSGYGAGLIGADGHNVISVYPGPNLLLTATHIQQAENTIAQAELVYAQFETSLEAIISAFHLARAKGIRTVLNPSPWQQLPPALLQETEVILVNEVEVQALMELSVNEVLTWQAWQGLLHEQLQRFWGQWPGGTMLVVTLGASGSLAFARNGDQYFAPAFKVDNLDSIGAGDAFACAFCVALARGDTVTEALRYGNACGAMMVSRLGVLQALPDKTELEAYLKSQV